MKANILILALFISGSVSCFAEDRLTNAREMLAGAAGEAAGLTLVKKGLDAGYTGSASLLVKQAQKEGLSEATLAPFARASENANSAPNFVEGKKLSAELGGLEAALDEAKNGRLTSRHFSYYEPLSKERIVYEKPLFIAPQGATNVKAPSAMIYPYVDVSNGGEFRRIFPEEMVAEVVHKPRAEWIDIHATEARIAAIKSQLKELKFPHLEKTAAMTTQKAAAAELFLRHRGELGGAGLNAQEMNKLKQAIHSLNRMDGSKMGAARAIISRGTLLKGVGTVTAVGSIYPLVNGIWKATELHNAAESGE